MGWATAFGDRNQTITLRCNASLTLELGRGLQVHWRCRRKKGPPGATARLVWGKVGLASLHRHTHTHTRPDPRLVASHPPPAPHTITRCGGHSPSARERISDTVLRMVGIVAAAAGESSAQILHLSVRGVECLAAAGAPPPTQGSAAAGKAPALQQQQEEATKVAPAAEPGELSPQPRRGRLGEGRSSGAGAGGGVAGARAHSFLRQRRARREKCWEGP